MYTPQAFLVDRSASLAFAAARGFGLVIAAQSGAGPVVSPLPFHLVYEKDGTPLARFHVAKANPLTDLAVREGLWLLVVMGPHAYVSPDWYASPDQAPTWLYQVVELSGPVRPLPASSLPQHLDDLSDRFEAGLAPKPPWSSNRIAPARRKSMIKAVQGIEMRIDAVKGSFKLNQHKSDADHIAVIAQLMQQKDAHSKELAAVMQTMRPHVDHNINDAAA